MGQAPRGHEPRASRSGLPTLKGAGSPLGSLCRHGALALLQPEISRSHDAGAPGRGCGLGNRESFLFPPGVARRVRARRRGIREVAG